MSFYKKTIFCFILGIPYGISDCTKYIDNNLLIKDTHHRRFTLQNVMNGHCYDNQFLTFNKDVSAMPENEQDTFAFRRSYARSISPVVKNTNGIEPDLGSEDQSSIAHNMHSSQTLPFFTEEHSIVLERIRNDCLPKRRLSMSNAGCINSLKNVFLTKKPHNTKPKNGSLDSMNHIISRSGTMTPSDVNLPSIVFSTIHNSATMSSSKFCTSATMSPIPFYDDKIILSLQGGGSRGYVAYSIIKSLREDLQLKAEEVLPVDMVVGVSIGALIGCVEVCGKIESLDFRKMSKDFFVPNEKYCLWNCTKKLMKNIPVVNWLSKPLGLIDYYVGIRNAIKSIPIVNSLCFGSIPFAMGYIFPKYSSSAKLRAIEHIFGNKTLADLRTSFCVPVADTQNRELRIIDSDIDRDLLVSDVIHATTAAPTFFDPHQFVIRDVLTEFADGGIVDNNPSDIALCQAKKKFPNSNIKIISIGNGEASVNAMSPSWNDRDLMFFGNTLPFYMMATSSNKTSYTISTISKSDPSVEYIEISPTFDENLIKMDITDDVFFEKVSNNAMKSCHANCSYAYNSAVKLLQHAMRSTVVDYSERTTGNRKIIIGKENT